MKLQNMRRVLLCTAAAVCTPAIVCAQAPAPADPSIQEVVVTGSRIARQDYVANSPIITASAEQLQRSGATTVDVALAQLPQFTGSKNSAEIIQTGGQANLDLRGLGSNRSLLLVNGRRMQPSNPDGTVDLNTLPQFLIENVEVITGGASTAYGSDAMAGVVNFKLRSSFTGVEADLQTGQSSRGDGATYDANLLLGGEFEEGRGNAMLLLNYAKRDGVLRGARPWFAIASPGTALPYGTVSLAGNAPSQAVVNSVFARYGVASGSALPTDAFGVNSDGTLFTSAPTTRPVANYRGPNDPAAFVFVDGNAVLYNTARQWSLQTPMERRNAYGLVNYKFSDALKVFGEVNYSGYTRDRITVPSQIGTRGTTLAVSATNPLFPADLRTLLAARPNPNAPIAITTVTEPLGVRNEHEEYALAQFTVGGSGELASAWTWDANASYGRVRNDTTQYGDASLSAMRTLLNAADGGQSICAGGLPIFGRQQWSQACIDYVGRTPKNRAIFEQKVAEANIQGELLSLPAGPIKLAAGLGYRANSYSFLPDDLHKTRDSAGFLSSSPAAGSTSVKEAYGELLVPLLRDVQFADELNLNLAYRYSDYEQVGGSATYKASFDWRPHSKVLLRGGYSRAIRAPSLLEMFSAASTVGVGLGNAVGPTGQPLITGDPCDIRGATRVNAGANAPAVAALCATQGVPSPSTFIATGALGVTAIREGNRNLQEETADTFSVGAVLRSPWETGLLSRAVLSVDYYNIKISDSIGVLALTTSISRCFNQDGVSNPTFSAQNSNCQLVRRNTSGLIDGALEPFQNLAVFQTSGVDIQGELPIELESLGLSPGAGRVTLRTALTYVHEFVVQRTTADAPIDFIGTNGNQAFPYSSSPKWKAVSSVSYAVRDLTAGVSWRYIGAVDDVSVTVNPASTTPGLSAFNYFDLFGSYRLSEKVELRGGVNNVADKAPEFLRGQLGNVDTRVYDSFGRQYYLGVNLSF